jgi:hypothetical protein
MESSAASLRLVGWQLWFVGRLVRRELRLLGRFLRRLVGRFVGRLFLRRFGRLVGWFLGRQLRQPRLLWQLGLAPCPAQGDARLPPRLFRRRFLGWLIRWFFRRLIGRLIGRRSAGFNSSLMQDMNPSTGKCCCCTIFCHMTITNSHIIIS